MRLKATRLLWNIEGIRMNLAESVTLIFLSFSLILKAKHVQKTDTNTQKYKRFFASMVENI